MARSPGANVWIFKSPLDHIIIKIFFCILKCVYWLIYLSEHVVIRINYFLRPSATKSKVAPPGGAKFKKLKNEQIWCDKRFSKNWRRFIKIIKNVNENPVNVWSKFETRSLSLKYYFLILKVQKMCFLSKLTFFNLKNGNVRP